MASTVVGGVVVYYFAKGQEISKELAELGLGDDHHRTGALIVRVQANVRGDHMDSNVSCVFRLETLNEVCEQLSRDCEVSALEVSQRKLDTTRSLIRLEPAARGPGGPIRPNYQIKPNQLELHIRLTWSRLMGQCDQIGRPFAPILT